MVHTMRPETQSSSLESLPITMKALDSYLAPRRVLSSFLSIGDIIDRMMCLTFHLCLLAFRFLSRSLVALGACTFTLVSQFGFVGRADQARVAASVASGVGFIGAGVGAASHARPRGN